MQATHSTQAEPRRPKPRREARLKSELLERRAQAVQHGLSPLSSRELEISELVADGCTNRQIARALFLSEKTVETHLAHAFVKLGVSSRAGLAGVVARAQRSGGSPPHTGMRAAGAPNPP